MGPFARKLSELNNFRLSKEFFSRFLPEIPGQNDQFRPHSSEKAFDVQIWNIRFFSSSIFGEVFCENTKFAEAKYPASYTLISADMHHLSAIVKRWHFRKQIDLKILWAIEICKNLEFLWSKDLNNWI